MRNLSYCLSSLQNMDSISFLSDALSIISRCRCLKVSLHVAFVHSFVNPLLFIVLHKGCRAATIDILCCNFGLPHGEIITYCKPF